MEEAKNAPTQTHRDSNTPSVYMPGMPALSAVELAASKLLRRRGSLEAASQSD